MNCWRNVVGDWSNNYNAECIDMAEWSLWRGWMQGVYWVILRQLWATWRNGKCTSVDNHHICQRHRNCRRCLGSSAVSLICMSTNWRCSWPRRPFISQVCRLLLTACSDHHGKLNERNVRQELFRNSKFMWAAVNMTAVFTEMYADYYYYYY